MRRFQFSIAGLLGVILLVALCAAAFRAGTDAWDSGVLAMVLAALLTSVLLAVHRTDQGRAYWRGFALFGWVYFALCLIPAIESRLPTTRALATLGSRWSGPVPGGAAMADFDNDGWVDLYVTNSASLSNVFLNSGNGRFVAVPQPAANQGSLGIWRALLGTTGTPENRARIMHSFESVLLAFAGGHLSRLLYARRPDRREGTEPQPSVPQVAA
jgi:hypothetical protein